MGSKDYSAAASRLAKLARRQHGLVTREQALQAEMSERAIDLRIASGEWHRILHGVYRLPGAGSSWLQDLTAVCLSLKGAVVSHRAAAALLKLGGFEPGMVELTTCRPQRPPEWLASEPPGRKAPTLLVHHSKLMPAKDVVKIERIPATSVARTLLELGAVVPEAEVERALDDALRRGLTSLVSLRRRLEELGRKGRGGTAVLRSLIESRVPGEIPESLLEEKLIRLLAIGRLPEPRKQFPVTLPNGCLVRLDLAYPEVKLAIEVDGYAFHSGRAAWARDLWRQNALTAVGWRVLHFTWVDVTDRPGYVIETLRRFF